MRFRKPDGNILVCPQCGKYEFDITNSRLDTDGDTGIMNYVIRCSHCGLHYCIDSTYSATRAEVIASFLEETHTDRPMVEVLKEEVEKLREEVNELREKHNKLRDATKTVLINHNKTIHKLCIRSGYIVSAEKEEVEKLREEIQCLHKKLCEEIKEGKI